MKTTHLIIYLLLISMMANSQNITSNYLLVINTHNYRGEPQKALNYYNNSITNIDVNIELQLSIGTTYYLLGNYTKAAIIFIKANTLNPKKANLELAQCYAQLHRTKLAIDYLRNYLEGKNKKMQRTIKSDEAFKLISNTPEWENLWRENDWYSKYDLMLEDAQYEFDLKNYEETLNILDRLNSSRKSMIIAYHLKSLTYLKVNEPKNALIAINTAISKRNKVAKYYATKAAIEIELNKPKKAIKSITTAIQIDSTKANYYFTRANAYFKSGKVDRVINDLEVLVYLIPNFEVYNLAGKIYSENSQYKDALIAYNKCIALDKYSVNTYIYRGDIYQKIYAYEFAEKDYTRALDFQPLNGELYYKRGLTRKLQHKISSACSDFNKSYKYRYMKADDELRGYCQ